MRNAEREFYRLLAELASDGLFNGPEREGMWERIVDAFEAAMASAKTANGSDDAHGPQQQQGNGDAVDDNRYGVWHGAAALGV